MGSIQGFIEKYNGVYEEEEEKSINTVGGNYSSQQKWGTTIFEGSKIIVAIDEVSGAHPVSELFRMKLILEHPTNFGLLIYPRSYWSRRLRQILLNANSSILETIDTQYKFTGHKDIVSHLLVNVELLDTIKDELVCINISKKIPKMITVTPAHGYRDILHLEKLARILKIVEQATRQTR